MPWTKGTLLWIREGREADGVIFVLRKRLGTAVRRNRLKRRLRHAARDLALPASRSIVVLAQRGAVAASFAGLRHELARLLDQLPDLEQRPDDQP